MRIIKEKFLREAAERLRVHESTVRRYADRGLIRAVRLPSGVRRLRGDDVEVLVRHAQAGPLGSGLPANTIETLAAEQHVPLLASLEALAEPDLWESEEEADLFVGMTRAERDRER